MPERRTASGPRLWSSRKRQRGPMATRIHVEQLEARTLLALSSATLLSHHETPQSRAAAAAVSNRNPAIFSSMMGALQAQVTRGPLAALAGGKISGGVFVARLSALVSTFDKNVARFLKPIAPRLVPLLYLQGNALTDTEKQWNERRIAAVYRHECRVLLCKRRDDDGETVDAEPAAVADGHAEPLALPARRYACPQPRIRRREPPATSEPTERGRGQSGRPG